MHILARERRVIVRDAIQVTIAPRQIDGAARRAKRIDDERIAKSHAFAGQSIKVRCLKPGKASLVALLALHHAKGVPALIVGVNKKEIWALLGRRANYF